MAKKWMGLAVRVPEEIINRFDERASLLNMNRSVMLRYLVDAFIEGRMSVRRSVETTQTNEDLHS